jgi:hypothetical protein
VHYSYNRIADNPPQLADQATLISIIVSRFQRLTPLGTVAQDEQQMPDISGREGQVLLERQ